MLEEHDITDKPTFTYHVLDVDCPSCANSVQNAVRTTKGVKDARLVYATATLEVVMEPGADENTVKRAVLATVRSCGEDLELSDKEKEELEEEGLRFADIDEDDDIQDSKPAMSNYKYRTLSSDGPTGSLKYEDIDGELSDPDDPEDPMV